MTKDLGTTNGTVSSLSTGLTSTDSNVASLTKNLGTTNSSISSLSTSLDTANSTASSLSTALTTADSNIASLSSTTAARVDALSTELDTMSTRIASFTAASAAAPEAAMSTVYATDKQSQALQAPSVTPGSNSVALGPTSSDDGLSNVVAVGSATLQRQITRVAPGTEGTDAVNLNQLNMLTTSMSQSFAGQQRQIDALGSQLKQTQQSVQHTDKMARQGIAAATALTMLPQVEPGKTVNMAIGVARFAGESGMAIGASAHFAANGILKLGIGVSGQNKTYGVGYGYSW